jgi:exonuclease SbcD
LSTQVDALGEALRRIARGQGRGSAQVLVSHCFARGGLVSDSERTIVGTASEVDASAFGAFDYVALGHLHRAQALTQRVHYSGSPLAYSFSEATDEKVVLSVDVAPGVAPVLRPIPAPVPRPMVILRDTAQALLEDRKYDAHAESYVRIDLTEETALHEPFARLKQRFPWLLDFRVHVAAARAEKRREAEARRARADVEADFQDFETMLRGDAPDDALLSAFRSVRADVAREESP